MTHRQFAETDELFKKACELAQLPPSHRQAAKWLANRGRASEFRQAAREILGMSKNGRVDLVSQSM
jgi:hypothetical protein